MKTRQQKLEALMEAMSDKTICTSCGEIGEFTIRSGCCDKCFKKAEGHPTMKIYCNKGYVPR